jgi:hypothetical protein
VNESGGKEEEGNGEDQPRGARVKILQSIRDSDIRETEGQQSLFLRLGQQGERRVAAGVIMDDEWDMGWRG